MFLSSMSAEKRTSPVGAFALSGFDWAKRARSRAARIVKIANAERMEVLESRCENLLHTLYWTEVIENSQPKAEGRSQNALPRVHFCILTSYFCLQKSFTRIVRYFFGFSRMAFSSERVSRST